MKHVFLGILFIFINLGLHAQGRNQDIKIGAKQVQIFLMQLIMRIKRDFLPGLLLKGL